ncbi:MAG: hypothetical protein P9L99_19680 [Candidatus Lernaella stagnicola]|nr:hypothetical protein [Candidatus Lernaella stagnicola]
METNADGCVFVLSQMGQLGIMSPSGKTGVLDLADDLITPAALALMP